MKGLADVLEELGAELREANSRGSDTLRLGGAEVELDVAIDVRGDGSVKFWVLNGSGGARRTRSAKIKIHMYPGQEEYGVGK